MLKHSTRLQHGAVERAVLEHGTHALKLSYLQNTQSTVITYEPRESLPPAVNKSESLRWKTVLKTKQKIKRVIKVWALSSRCCNHLKTTVLVTVLCPAYVVYQHELCKLALVWVHLSEITFSSIPSGDLLVFIYVSYRLGSMMSLWNTLRAYKSSTKKTTRFPWMKR